MILSIEINNRLYKFNAGEPLDISIPLDFGGAQPNAFSVQKASAKACEAGNLIGDTRRGGSCNFEEIKFVPHCNGTHTESIGHITFERISVHDCLRDSFIPSNLLTIKTEKASETNETYSVNLEAPDELITRKNLESALKMADENFLKGLIVRTLPNDESKKARDYSENSPPFFSLEAMKFIIEKGVRHLLVDTPSIDRTRDEGKLANHRIFWNVEPGSFEFTEKSFPDNTITEMIFAPDEIKDGAYLLNLQIPSFISDAAPSRPILFAVKNSADTVDKSESLD